MAFAAGLSTAQDFFEVGLKSTHNKNDWAGYRSMTAPHWTKHEWHDLAERVALIRAKRPELSLVQLTKLAQEHWPVDRRKLLTAASKEQPELLDRLRRIDRELRETAEQKRRLEQQLNVAPAREEILNSLSDDEIVQRFAGRVLSRLAALATGGLLAVLDTYGQVAAEHDARQPGLRIADETDKPDLRRMEGLA